MTHQASVFIPQKETWFSDIRETSMSHRQLVERVILTANDIRVIITMPILVLAGQKAVDDTMVNVAIRPREVPIRQA